MRSVVLNDECVGRRCHMMQEWADMIDAWVAGESYTPVLLPPSMKLVTTAAQV